MISFGRIKVDVAVGNPDLARAIEQGLDAAISNYVIPPRYPFVRLRTRRRLAALGSLAGHIAVVRVTERGLRRLPALVEEIRAQGPLGVQLVWDGVTPARPLAEPAVFSVLEKARATKAGPPVMLAAKATPVLALRTAIADRMGS